MSSRPIIATALLSLALPPSLATASSARDYINIVGSSTVYPFATVVAERFGKTTEFKTPKIESTGSGGGLKLFCTGVGVEHPDITNASRRMKKSEFDRCNENGVREIVEVKMGYDGIAIANSRKSPQIELTLQDLFLALAKDVPDPNGGNELVPNPYTTWKEVNPSLPDVKIEVLGPPPTSGTRDAFVELAMEGGCKRIPTIKAISAESGEAKKQGDNARAASLKKKYQSVCHTIREDGAYVEAGENDNLIVQKLTANPDSFGVFGFSFLDQNSDKVHGAKVDGVPPEFEAIADGSYPVSRSLYFYVKKAHVDTIPGIREYLSEFTSEKAWGDEGYLADKGLIPMPEPERARFASDVKNMKDLMLK